MDRRNQSHHGRRAAPLQQTLRLSARYGRIGQAKEEDEATNDGEPAINMQETDGTREGNGGRRDNAGLADLSWPLAAEWTVGGIGQCSEGAGSAKCWG